MLNQTEKGRRVGFGTHMSIGMRGWVGLSGEEAEIPQTLLAILPLNNFINET